MSFETLFNINETAVLGWTNASLVVTFLASFLVWAMFLGLAILWFIDGRIKKAQALHAFFASLISWTTAQMIKSIVPSIRPFLLNGENPMTITVPSDAAFPSGHAALAFGLAVTIYLHNKKLGIIYILGAILVAIGRVWANVHYPIDVLGGAVLGVAVSLAIEKLHPYSLLKK
jgi:undecaprenyl-diphosphatase